MKLDYFDIELALHGISTLILEYQTYVKNKTNYNNPRYNEMLHTAEEKFQHILQKMEHPPENEMRPAEIT